MGMTDYYGKPYAREDTAATSSAAGLTASVYSPSLNEDPRSAVITVEGGSDDGIQYCRDGTTPVAGSVGDVHLAGNDPIVLWGLESIQKFRYLEVGTTPAVLIHCTYFR